MLDPRRVGLQAILLAHVGPRGRLPADLRSVATRLGVCASAYDAALKGLRDHNLLVLVGERFMRPEFVSPDPEADTKRAQRRQLTERAAAARQAMHARWAQMLAFLADGGTTQGLARMFGRPIDQIRADVSLARRWDREGRPADFVRKRRAKT